MLRTDELTQLGFDHCIVGMSIFHHFLGQSNIFFKGQVAAVDHNTGETFVDTVFAEFKAVTVIQMNSNGNIGKTDSSFDKLLQINRVGIAASAFGNLENKRSFFFFARSNNALYEFHVINVKSAKSIFPF